MRTKSRERARQALNVFYDTARLTDDEIGAMLNGASRQTGTAKRHGKVRISLDDLDYLAEGLDVPPAVFLMEEDELRAWIRKKDWRGPPRRIDLRDQPKRDSTCGYLTESQDPLPFPQDDDSDVIDLREHILNQTTQKDSLYLLAETG